MSVSDQTCFGGRSRQSNSYLSLLKYRFILICDEPQAGHRGNCFEMLLSIMVLVVAGSMVEFVVFRILNGKVNRSVAEWRDV